MQRLMNLPRMFRQRQLGARKKMGLFTRKSAIFYITSSESQMDIGFIDRKTELLKLMGFIPIKRAVMSMAPKKTLITGQN
jgi:hypothetical protein